MIERNELRFGNLIKSRSRNEIICIDSFDVFKRVSRLSVTHEYIVLTEEWLTKLGFGINMTQTAWWNEHEFLISEDNDGFYFGIWHDINDDPYVEHVCDVRYVHQLQNLHLIITGQELILK